MGVLCSVMIGFLVLFVVAEAEAGPPSDRTMRMLMGEDVLAENVQAIRLSAAQMSPDDRFEFLMSWVWPEGRWNQFRLAGVFTPTDPSPLAMESVMTRPGGGVLESPVFELLKTARETGRLPQLRRRLAEMQPAEGLPSRKSQLAMSILLSWEADDHSTIERDLEQLFKAVQDTRPASLGDVWPETLVVARCVYDDRHSPLLVELAGHMMLQWAQRNLLNQFRPWTNHVAAWAGILTDRTTADTTSDGDAFAEAEIRRYWVPVSRKRASSRGLGFPQMEWRLSKGTVKCIAGHDDDFLYLRSPLPGDTDVQCLMQAPGIAGSLFLMGGEYVGVRYNGREVEYGTIRSGSQYAPLEQLSPFEQWIRYRSRRRSDTIQSFINGRPVRTSTATDPWLAARSWSRHHSAFRDIRLQTTGEIPATVSLSSSSVLSGWVPYYEDTVAQENSPWMYDQDEQGNGCILSVPRTSFADTHYESALVYHRPLEERSVIELEFFYEPGESEIHPMIGREAFLINAEGIQRHWITDGRWDTTEVAPDNRHPLPREPDQPLPKLKAGDWNRLQLSVEGAAVSISVNGRLAGATTLFDPEQRQFGLFCFPGFAGGVVRNITLSGNWPKELPEVNQQVLADPAVSQLDLASGQLPARWLHDFAAHGLPPQLFSLYNTNPPGLALPTSLGVNVIRPGIGKWCSTDVQLPIVLHGDFDVIAEFQDLNVQSNKDGAVMLAVHLDDNRQHQCRCIRQRSSNNREEVLASISELHEKNQRSYTVIGRERCEASAGRLRICRRGEQVWFLCADHDSDQYAITGSMTLTNAASLSDGIQLRALCDGTGMVQVMWKSIQVAAERMTWLPSGLPPEPRHLYSMKADGSDLKIVGRVPEGLTQMGSPTWLPDGRRVGFDSSAGNTSTSRIILSDLEAEKLQDIGAGCMPSFSPDGKRLVISDPNGGAVLMNADGSNRESLDRSGWGTQWSPDGRWIMYGKSGNLVLMDARDRTTRLLLNGDDATRYSYFYWNAGWSPNSKSICAKARRSSDGKDDIVIVDILPEPKLEVLHSDISGVNADFAWTADSRAVIFSMHSAAHKGPRLFVSRRDSSSTPEPWPGQPDGMKIFDCAVSPDGTTLLFSGQRITQPVDFNPPSLPTKELPSTNSN